MPLSCAHGATQGHDHDLGPEVRTWKEAETSLAVAKERIRNLQQDMDRAGAIVSLEGPGHLQTFIDTLDMSALIVAAGVGRFEGTTAELVDHVDDDIDSAESATFLFAEVASDYLNSGKQRKRLLSNVEDAHLRIRRQQVG